MRAMAYDPREYPVGWSRVPITKVAHAAHVGSAIAADLLTAEGVNRQSPTLRDFILRRAVSGLIMPRASAKYKAILSEIAQYHALCVLKVYEQGLKDGAK